MTLKDFDASDENLAILAQNGDTNAITQLICRYLPQIRRKAGSYSHSPADRDDLVQEGMIGLLCAVRTFDSSQKVSFKTYSGVCIQNKMLTEVGKHQDHQQPLQDYLLLDELERSDDSPNNGDPFRIVVQQEDRDLLMEKAKTLLSDLEQETLSLYLSGYSYKEMANELNLSTKAVDNALQRVRRKLREG